MTIDTSRDVFSATPSASYCYDEAAQAKAIFVFAHGAGANKNHAFMDQFTALLLEQQISVLRFNFLFMDKRALDGKRYPPDRMPKLTDCYLDVIAQLSTGLPLFIGGKSMGGRVAATLACAPIKNLRGIICIGYPFHPAKKLDKLRLEPLIESKYPIFITQGERDLLGNKEEVLSYQLPSLIKCIFLPDGDHDLKPRVKSGFTHLQNMKRAAEEVSRFIDES